MQINGQDDHFARWVQGACAVPLLMLGLFDLCLDYSGSYGRFRNAAGFVCLYLAYRCLSYAFTGRQNINLDDDL